MICHRGGDQQRDIPNHQASSLVVKYPSPMLQGQVSSGLPLPSSLCRLYPYSPLFNALILILILIGYCFDC